jgi:hypothetical protein
MIEHDTILNILQHMGFDDVWLKCIKCLLDSGHSSILLNGVPVILFIAREALGKAILSRLYFLLQQPNYCKW